MRFGEFLIYRLWAMIIQVLGAVALIFSLVSILPYDPTLFFLFGFTGSEESRERALAELRQSFGLDLPLYQRYYNFFYNLIFEGSLGKSWITGDEISYMFADSMMFSFLVFGFAFLIYTPLSFVFGILSAQYKDSIFDYFMKISTTAIYSVPPIILGLWVIIYSVRKKWRIAPFPTETVLISELLVYLILPILLTILIYTGFQFRLVRIHMLNILQENYIRTARAKGLPERTVIYKHALKNAIPYFFTTIAVTFPIAFSGVVGLEIVFGIPGGGMLMVNAALNFDWPILIAGTAVYTTINAFILAINDILIFKFSPKQKFRLFAS